MLSLKQEIRLANQESLQKGEEMFTIFQKFMINTQTRTNQEEIPISTLAQVSQMSLEAASLPPQSHNPTQPNLITLLIIQTYLLYTVQLPLIK